MMRLVSLVASAAFYCACGSVTVGVLAGHSASAWSKDAPDGCGDATGKDLHQCNLKVYTAAVATAAKAGVDLLVFPEGYSLGNSAMPGDYYEPLGDDVAGTTPCDSADADTHAAQKSLSCAAASHGVALAANVMTQASNGTKHITELVFDKQGVVVTVYHKHSLFPNEALFGIASGAFAPSTFEMFGQRWGVVICYEGLKPFVSRDFSQFEGLVAQGASAFVWSVGGTVGMLSHTAKSIANKYGVKVVATEGYAFTGALYDYSAIIDETGSRADYVDVPINTLEDFGYTKSAFVQVASLTFSNTIAV